MVTTGFSRIHVATYSNSGSTVTYSGVKELARAKSMSSSIESSEESKFYANNQVAEIAPSKFLGGELNVVVDGLTADEETLLYGLTTGSVQVNGSPVATVEFGESSNSPYFGVGAIKQMQLNGVVSYRPIVFTKVRFTVGADEAETQEDGVNYQVQELAGQLMRDDTLKHNWKIMPKENMTTEEEAVDFIKAVLGGAA